MCCQKPGKQPSLENEMNPFKSLTKMHILKLYLIGISYKHIQDNSLNCTHTFCCDVLALPSPSTLSKWLSLHPGSEPLLKLWSSFHSSRPGATQAPATSRTPLFYPVRTHPKSRFPPERTAHVFLNLYCWGLYLS